MENKFEISWADLKFRLLYAVTPDRNIMEPDLS
jgi:hypothetical protein